MRRLASSLAIALMVWFTPSGPATLRAADERPAPVPAIPSAQPSVTTSPTPTTRLYVKTVPPGAEVTLDGKPLGPSDGLFIVPPGTANVKVEFAGQEPRVQQVEIAAGRITRLEIDFTAAAAGDARADRRLAANGGAAASGPAAGVANVALKNEQVPRSARALRKPPAAVTPLDDQIRKPVVVVLDEVPLRVAMGALATAAGIDVVLDERALENAGVGTETPVTVHARALPLASVLDTVCGSHDLAWTVRDRELVITTNEHEQEHLLTHVHEVSDLLGDDLDPDPLITAIRSTLAPECWEVNGGIGTIRPDVTTDGARLVVSHTLGEQRRLAGMLARMRTLKATPSAERVPLAAEGYWSDSAQAAAIRWALGQAVPGPLTWNGTSLRTVLARLAFESGIPISVDEVALVNIGVDVDTAITLEINGDVSLARVLERVLDPHDLVASLERDQLIVTTKERAQERLSVAIYPVDRLLSQGRTGQGLLDMLRATVMQLTWEEQGGPAHAVILDGDVPCMVVSQTTEGHRAVDGLLCSLDDSVK